MRHLPYFSVAFSGGEGHLDARGKRQGGGKAPMQFICKARYRLVHMQGLPVQHYPPFKIDNKKRLMRHNEGKTDERRGISRERKRRSEQRLSDVQEAGSKKASSNTCY